MVMSKFWQCVPNKKITVIIQAVETGVRFGGRNFPTIEFAGTKSPDLAFSNVNRYGFVSGVGGHRFISSVGQIRHSVI